jgi:hypothetical protein
MTQRQGESWLASKGVKCDGYRYKPGQRLTVTENKGSFQALNLDFSVSDVDENS